MSNASGDYADGQIWDSDDANWVAGFGDGSDGAFSQTGASTTNLVQGTVYQYTTFNLGAAHTISASSTSDKPIIILVQGDATISGTINLSGKGCDSSFTGYADTGLEFSTTRVGFGLKGSAGSNRTQAGIKGMKSWNIQQNQFGFIMNGTCGGAGSNDGASVDYGGGGGASSSNSGTNGESAASDTGSVDGGGGPGGCTILMLVGGDLTLGVASVINTSGAAGTSADRTGGGGGGAGDILIFCRGTLTDNGVTKTVTGGAAGLDTGDGDADGGAGGAGYSKIAAWDTVLWGRGT